MGRVEAECAALHVVDSYSYIHALPQVLVLDWDESAESLPHPVATPPFLQESEATAYLIAGRDQRDSRGLVERFETADNGQQVQPLAANAVLDVRRLQFFRAIHRLQ